MKFLPILFLFLLFPSQSNAEYKMVAVNGAPELKDSYQWNVTLDLKWEDCLQECMGSLNCHMVYHMNEKCLFYLLGDYIKIRNDGSESTMANEMVAFKVDLPNGQCLGSAISTLASQTGSYESTGSLATDITSFGISVTPESYDVSYNYADECSSPHRMDIPCEKTCNTRMYRFIGTISFEKGYQWPQMMWNQCVNKCFREKYCFFVASNRNLSCVTFGITSFTEFTISDSYEIDLTTLDYMAIKLYDISPYSSCPADETAVFNRIVDFSYWLQIGSPLNSLHMKMNKTGNTVDVEWLET